MKNKLLIISDNQNIIEDLKNKLEIISTINTVADVQQAKQFLLHADSVNVVFVEISYSDSAKLDFIQWAHGEETLADTIIVALVPDAARDNAINLLSIGFDDWCNAGMEAEDLVNKVQKLIKQKSIFKRRDGNSISTRSLLENSFMGIVVIDAINFDVLYINNTAKELMEIGNEDYHGKKCYNLLVKKKHQCPDCHFYSALKGNTSSHNVYIPKIEKTLNIKVNTTEWFGRPAYVEYFKDITNESRERQLAMERYQKELQRRRRVDLDFMAYLVVDVTKGVVVDHDPHGFPVPVLKPGQRMQDFAEKVLPTLTDYEERKHFTEMMRPEYLQKAYETGNDILKIDCRRYARNQKYIMWTRSVIQLLKNPENDNLMMFLYTYDINEHKMQQEIIDSIVKYNYKVIAYINTYAETIKLYASEGVYEHDTVIPYTDYNVFLETNLKKYVQKDEWETLKPKLTIDNLITELKTKDKYDLHINFQFEGLMHAYILRFANYQDSTYGLIQGLLIDINEILEPTRYEISLLKEQVSTLTRENNIMSLYLASISHNLMSPIKNIGMTLKKIGTLSSKADVAQAKKDLSQLEGVINDINYICSLSSGIINSHEVQFTLSDLVEKTVQKLYKLYPKYKKQLIIEKDIFHEACYGDYRIIQKILFNILDNAFKYAATYGNISFSVNELPATEADKGYFRFTIKDNGMGIQPNILKNIFKPFYYAVNTKNKSNSSGLGLAISKSLVDKLNGSIQIESELTHGTTVTVDLAFPRADHIRESVEEKNSHHNNMENIQVLFVENDKLTTLVARRLLEQKGMRIITCDNIVQARALLKKHSFNCMVLVLESGKSLDYDFINSYTANASGTAMPIVVICDELSPQARVAMIQRGIECIFFKPLKFAEFNDKIMEICHIEI